MASDPRAALTAGVLRVVAGVMAAATIVIVAAMSPQELTASPAAVLGGWLAAAVGTVVCAEASAARAVTARSTPRTRAPAGHRAEEKRKVGQPTTAVVSLLLLAELGWFLVAFVWEGAYGLAGAVGGALLVLLLAATRRVASLARNVSGFTASESLAVTGVFLVSEASLGWLAVRFAAAGPWWGAAAVGGVAVALAAAFWLILRPSIGREAELFRAHGVVAVCSFAGVVAETAARVSAVAAWVMGGTAVVVVAGLWLGAGGRPSGRITERSTDVSPQAQLAGVAVPLAGVVGVVLREDPWGVTDAGPLLLGGLLAAAAAVLLALQGLVLAWLGTDPWRHQVRRFARKVVSETDELRWRLGDHRPGSGRGPSPRAEPGSRWEDLEETPEEYLRGLRRGHGDALDATRTRQQYERRLQDLLEVLRGENLPSDESLLAGLLRRLRAPFASGRLFDLEMTTALATGLAVEQVWPRIALVVQDSYGRRVRDLERAVQGWRLVTAAAVCTAFSLLVVPLLGADPRVALAAPGPLLLAFVALPRAHRALLGARRLKAEAVRLRRRDLLQTLRLAPPADGDLLPLAPELSGDPSSYPRGYPYPERPETVEERARAEARADLRAVVREQLASFARRIEPPAEQAPAPSAPLTDDQLARLAEQVALLAADPVAERLKAQLTRLQRQFQDEVYAAVRESVDATVRESVDAAVGGAPLSNFVGYVAIELDRRPRSGGVAPSARAERGTIKAPAGGRVDLVVSVVRDDRARQTDTVVRTDPGKDFFVFEPVRLEGGRDDDTVTFDALVDSSTLTPLPQRRNVRVTEQEQVTFGFQLPAEEGRHEVWFQLYQSGRLVQVTAIGVEAVAGPAPSPAAAT